MPFGPQQVSAMDMSPMKFIRQSEQLLPFKIVADGIDRQKALEYQL